MFVWITVTLSYVFYAEFLIYQLQSDTWPKLGCKNEQSCTRILLVADPQIIGNLNEVVHPVTPFSIFDSDR